MTLTAPTPLTESAPVSFPPPLPARPLELWQLDERKFTCREWWRQIRSPLVLIGWGAIVSLARPVPGIFADAALTGYAI